MAKYGDQHDFEVDNPALAGNNENSTETLLGCIERNTYNLSEIFQHAKIGIGSRAQDVKDVTWKENFSSAYAGWIKYTLFFSSRFHLHQIRRVGISKLFSVILYPIFIYKCIMIMLAI